VGARGKAFVVFEGGIFFTMEGILDHGNAVRGEMNSRRLCDEA